MKQIQKYTSVLFFLLIFLASLQTISKTVDDVKANINWPAFMSRNDMVWTQMPDGWTSGAFTGNGILGTIFWQQPGGLYFEISRTDAYDHPNSTSIYTGRYRLPNGNFTLEYAGRNPEGQMWVDGIFMGQMFLVRYGKSIGDRNYAFGEAIRQITAFARHAMKGNSGLYYHAISANPELVNWADPATGLSPEVWSEGLGWYALVLAETLAVIPADHPRYGEVLDIFQRLAQGLIETQDNSHC